MKQLYYLIIAAVLITITGCNSITDNEPRITHRPFKYEKTDRWGMLGVDGTVLFENEFENEPSCVLNGVFFVKNENGMYEYYTAEAKPKLVGNKEYVAASYFVEDVAPVVEPEQYITFINKDGTLAFKFDKYKDKNIVCTDNFSEGLAAFKTSDNLHGFVDTKGKIVIEPIYSSVNNFSEGLAVVSKGQRDTYKTFVINKKGEQQFAIKVSNDSYVASPAEFCNGYLPVQTGLVDGNHARNYEFILNKKGEQVYEFKQNREEIVGNVVNDKFLTLNNSGKIGLQNLDGEILIRSKYDNYNPCLFKDYIIAKDNEKFGVIDLEDNILVPFEYDVILPFVGSNAFVRDRNEWFLINKKGEQINKKQTFEELGGIYDDGTNEIRSDYFDINTFIKLATGILKENSYDIIKLGDPVSEVLKKWPGINFKDHVRLTEFNLILSEDEGVIKRRIIPQYDNYVAKTIIEREQYGYYSWQSREVIKGYQANNDAKVLQIIIELDIIQNIRNKKARLTEALTNWAKSNGYTYFHSTDWNNDHWSVYKNPNGYGLVILNDKDSSYGPVKIIIIKLD